ncbi:MAG: DUF2946 domain-containing protein [Rhodanobacter sp.]|nr:MAG: DUF2946 domain-containing protein [Rhodanobacter sp.]
MKPRGLHRLIAIAAHFALLLAVCAPAVSRLLVVHGMSGGSAANASSMQHMRHGPSMPDESATSTHRPDGKTPMDACGYCTFFAHAPISQTVVPTLAILPPLPTAKIPATVAEGLRHVTDASFRPRGPPTHLVVS